MRIIKIIHLLVALFSMTTMADTYSKEQFRVFFGKLGMCQLVFGFESDGTKATDSNAKFSGSMLLCIGDIRLNVGTINEVSGCAFGKFNSEKSLLESPYYRNEEPSKLHKSGYPMIDKIACEAGGFEALLDKYAGVFYGTVKAAITRGPDGGCMLGGECDKQFIEPFLVYSSSSLLEKKWSDLKGNYIDNNKKIRRPKKTTPPIDCASSALTMEDMYQCKPENEFSEDACTLMNSESSFSKPELAILLRIYKARFKKKLDTAGCASASREQKSPRGHSTK